LEYWITAIPLNKGQFICQEEPNPVLQLANDAGDGGWGGTLDDGCGNKYLAQGLLPARYLGTSSTLREVVGHLNTWLAFKRKIVTKLRQMAALVDALGHHAASRQVLMLLDSQAAVGCLEIGSPIEEIQDVVYEVFMSMERTSIIRHHRWRSRNADVMGINDDLSKLVDNSDWQLARAEFQAIEAWAGYTHTIDRFATADNALCSDYNTRYYTPGCVTSELGPSAWVQPWRHREDGVRLHYNWLHPPYSKIGEAVRRLRFCRARGTILVPLDTRQLWWPLLVTGAAGTVRPYAATRRRIRARPGLLLRQGRYPCSKPPRTDLLAIQLDFSSTPCSP
jgi:hypothetical protein